MSTPESPTIINTIFCRNYRNGAGLSTGASITGFGADIHSYWYDYIIFTNSILHVLRRSSETGYYWNWDSYGLVSSTGEVGSTVSIYNQDPLLVDEGNGDLRLSSCSSAINVGTPDTTGLNLGLIDLDGNPRVSGSSIDLGAYEFQPSSLPRPLTVTNTNDDGCGSLRFLVTFAASGDTIRFSPSINHEAIELLTQIELDKDLVFLGNDTTNTIIDGMVNSRIFKINSGKKITIDGIRLQNGKADGSLSSESGGAIYNSGSLSVVNSGFTKNTATSSGGAIYNDLEASASFNMSNISENTADFSGGGVHNNGILSFKNCIISGNSSDGNGGGVSDRNKASFTNTVISGNLAASKGGGVNVDAANSSFVNCTIAGNSATSTGGGVEVSPMGSTAGFINSIVAENSATNSPNISGIYTDVSNNVIGGDPLFITAVPTAPSTGGNLRLQSCLPAVNSGTADTTGLNLGLVDIDGNPRVFGDRIDIGAFELQKNSYTTAIFVDINATGINDGSSWNNAYTDLQDAIDNNGCGLSIWVAKGTYYPTSGTDRTVSFELQNDIKIYGGFAGNETDLAQRDLATNTSILSGDIDHSTAPDVITGSGTTLSITGNTGNSYHVIVTANLSNAALIDGFTITGGYGNVSSTYTSAGVPVTGNDGGGIYNHFSDLTISNTIFSGNEVTDDGGGIYNRGGAPTIVNCVFASNYSASSGGGIYNTSASPTITNTTISGNYAVNGGGIRNWDGSNPTISNSIIWNNANDEILNANSTPVLSHSIIEGSGGSSAWNNTFGTDNGSNIDSDPLFVDAANGDFSLQTCSPAINAGTTESHTADIFGNPHVGVIDMGATEYQGTLVVNLNVTEPISTGPEAQTAQYITSESIISSPSKIEFNAFGSVELKPGFQAINGSVFEAKIVPGCL
jgi:predicted outer membrane repeat protein